MKYALRDFPALLRTPLGRRQFFRGLRYRAFPLYAARARWRRQHALRETCLVAVVGSFGKTTGMRATNAALGLPPEREWCNNAFSGLARGILRIPRDAQYHVAEAGINAPGQMERYARILQPDITVVTSVGSEHATSLGNLSVTRHEKAFMVRALPAHGVAVLNGDDPSVDWMATQTAARVVRFGLERGNDLSATDIEFDWPRGTRFQLRVGSEVRPVTTRLFGLPMVYATLAGIAAAQAAGRPLDAILEAVAGLPPTPGRLAATRLGNDAWLLDDSFKAPLESIHAALDALSQCGGGRRFIVMGQVSEPPGSMGPIYRELGARMAGMAERVYIVGGNYQRYAAGARAAGHSADHFVDAGKDLAWVAQDLGRRTEPGDIILVKGRDTQRLDRVSLRLTGNKVSCDTPFCDARRMCRVCPMCERGWGAARVVI